MPSLTMIALASAVVLAAADQVPRVDIDATCGASLRSDRAFGEQQGSTDACAKDERDAKAELESHWSSYDTEQRARCSREITIGGSPSYVELLVCIQMLDWSRAAREGQGTTRQAPAPQRR